MLLFYAEVSFYSLCFVLVACTAVMQQWPRDQLSVCLSVQVRVCVCEGEKEGSDQH